MVLLKCGLRTVKIRVAVGLENAEAIPNMTSGGVRLIIRAIPVITKPAIARKKQRYTRKTIGLPNTKRSMENYRLVGAQL